MKNRKQNAAFTLMEVMVVIGVVFLLFIVAGLFPMALARSGPKELRARCMNNLKQVYLSFREWASDNNEKFPMGSFTNQDGTLPFHVFQVMSNELGSPRILACPADVRQSADDFRNLTNTNLSYFVGLDADETKPAMWLVGDRNLETNGVELKAGLVSVTTADKIGWSDKIHRRFGNVLLSDGSVHMVDVGHLQDLLLYTGTNAIRLAIP